MNVRKRERPSGAVVWEGDFRAGGKRIRKTLCDADGVSKKEAMDLCAVFYSECRAKAGEVPAEARPTLGLVNALAHYMNRPTLAKATVQNYHAKIKNLLRLLDGAMDVNNISSADVQGYQVKRLTEGAARRTVNMETQVLFGALKNAKADNLANPTVSPTMLPHSTKETRALTKNELNKLLEELDANRARWVGPFARFLAATGLRRGEAARMTWDDVDFEGKRLATVVKKRGATRSFRRIEIPLNKTALGILEQRRGAVKHRLVFAKAGDPPGLVELPYNRMQSFYRTMRRAAAKAGISKPDEVTPHCLRHTFCTLLGQSGVGSVEDLRRLMRHSSVEMTLRYMRPSEKTMRKATGVMDEILG